MGWFAWPIYGLYHSPPREVFYRWGNRDSEGWCNCYLVMEQNLFMHWVDMHQFQTSVHCSVGHVYDCHGSGPIFTESTIYLMNSNHPKKPSFSSLSSAYRASSVLGWGVRDTGSTRKVYLPPDQGNMKKWYLSLGLMVKWGVNEEVSMGVGWAGVPGRGWGFSYGWRK